MQNRPRPIIRLVHGDGIFALCDLEAGLGNLARDAVFAAREFLAVAAVADGRACLFLGIVEVDFVADFPAVAPARDDVGHFGSGG